MRNRLGSRPVPPVSDRSLLSFWMRVRIRSLDECWVWGGCANASGYGVIHLNSGRYLAHRVAFAIANHGASNCGEVVRHSCDNRLCVNPYHLISGTIEDNVVDRNSKGRQAKGERCARRKLSGKQVAEMRSRYVRYGRPNLKELSAEYGVTLDQVHRVITNKSWRS